MENISQKKNLPQIIINKNQIVPIRESCENSERTEEELAAFKALSFLEPINRREIVRYSVLKGPRVSCKRHTIPTVDGMEMYFILEIEKIIFFMFLNRGEYMLKEISGRRRRFVENARKTHYYFEMLKVVEIGSSIYAMIALIFSILAVFIFYCF